MLTLVIDINCLLQVIPRQAPNRWLYDLMLQGRLSLAISSEILLEYREVLEQKTNASVADNIVTTLLKLPDTTQVNPTYRWQLIRDDVDDDKYVDCAVAASADYLISDDRHFNVLDTCDFPQITRLRLAQARQFIAPDRK